jgi:hypothetical protein
VKVFPDDTNMLMSDSGRYIGVVGGSEVFAKVERLFQVGCALLKVFAANRGAVGSTRGNMFILAGDGGLSQLSRELIERILRFLDIYAASSGRA